MAILTDPDKLIAQGYITQDIAEVMRQQARGLMVPMAINVILCFGILCATGGLIFWLTSPASVALVGGFLLGAGFLIRLKGYESTAMFGSSAILIGSGMIIGGAGLELVDKYPDIASFIMVPAGAVVAAITARALVKGGLTGPFVQGSILLMGVALHLSGLGFYLAENGISGAAITAFYLYATGLIALSGWVTDVRFITALAILPFAQALETGTFYFHAMYAFYSPESTLSILQMSLLIIAMLWLASRLPERGARHARILSLMGFIVANLCALVGSLWGDRIGETLWGPQRREMSWDEYKPLRDAFNETAVFITPELYSILWALALVAIIAWTAFSGRRGLFNTALTFAGIHAYTQLFETFGDEPLAYVIGGLAAIPLAWGLWRLDGWLSQRQNAG